MPHLLNGVGGIVMAVALAAGQASAQTGYVTEAGAGVVQVINAATNTVTATINLGAGSNPVGVAVTPNGASVYVASFDSNTVSAISTASNTITATIPVEFCLSGWRSRRTAILFM